jgi:hypothetical protein
MCAVAGVALSIAIGGFAACPTQALAAANPTKWVLSYDIGRNVDRTKVEGNAPQEERNECTALSKDICQAGEVGHGSREMSYPETVAVNKLTGDVYVGANNHRIQVLDPEGQFLFMFGWNVNGTKVALGSGATQEEKNICTAASGDKCGEGENGTGLAGQLSETVESVAIDQTTGNLYILDRAFHRIDEYTASGKFVLMIGGQVNKKGGNVCTQAEESECEEGVEGSGHDMLEKLADGSYGNAITVGPEGLLYVGEEGGVQKLKADGAWAGKISVPGVVTGVAVDPAEDVFVTDRTFTGVHEYNAKEELQSCVLDATSETIGGIALNAADQLGITETPEAHVAVYDSQGSSCGKFVSEVLPPSGTLTGFPAGIAFSAHGNSKGEAEDQLYVANENNFDVEGYVPVLFPEVATCETLSVSFTSAIVCGTINANGVHTRGFFRYGFSGSLEDETPTAFLGEGTVVEPFSDELTDLIPNQVYYDQAWVEAPSGGVEQLAPAPEIVSFRTRGPPPEISGAPIAAFVTDQSAALSATVNPEHAATRYHFEYAQCENESQAFAACGEPRSTPDIESAVYGSVGVEQEIAGLAPQASYVYRLVADNDFETEGMHEGGQAVGAEGHLTTGSLPIPTASTGEFGAVTATGAVIAGTVDPDGAAATYVFELGLYDGANTQYGIVFSGPVEAGLGPLEEQLALSGLQPGTSYAYRIAIRSGYVSSPNGETQGETRVFTTGGLPAALESPSAPPMLAIPSIKFPVEAKPPAKATVRCKRGYQRNKHGKCVKKAKRAKKATSSRKPAGSGGTGRR